MVCKVLQSSDRKLRQVSKPVGEIDKKVQGVIRDLKDTLTAQKEPEGVGLAAPQIGKNLRIFLVSYQDIDRVVINPEILEIKSTKKEKRTKKHEEVMEGCLSLPNFYGPLTRPNYVKIKYMDDKGEQKVEEFKDFFAQIILHEMDHLDGILFIDKLLSDKKPLFRLKGRQWQEVDLI